MTVCFDVALAEEKRSEDARGLIGVDRFESGATLPAVRDAGRMAESISRVMTAKSAGQTTRKARPLGATSKHIDKQWQRDKQKVSLFRAGVSRDAFR